MIEDYLGGIIESLLVSQAVASFKVIRKEITDEDGYIRVRCDMTNSDIFEFAEYVAVHKNKIVIETYSYHWQRADGDLIKRWDNVPHHREIDTFPHHLHLADGKVVGSLKISFKRILREVERTIIEGDK